MVFVIFWLVVVWLLPERAILLKKMRVYMAAGIVPMTIGAWMYQKSGATKKVGAWISALGFGCGGACFALGFYLFFSSMFK